MATHYGNLPSLTDIADKGRYVGDDGEGRPNYVLNGILYRIEELFIETWGERTFVVRVHAKNCEMSS